MAERYRNPSSLPVNSLKLNPLNARHKYGCFTVEEANHIVNDTLSEEEIREFHNRLMDLPEDNVFRALLLDIAANGVQQLIIVNRVDENFYHPVAGGNHRVLCAHFANKVLNAEIKGIPAKVAPLMSEEDQMVAQWSENNLRTELSDADKAILFRKLIDKGWTHSDICEKLPGVTKPEIKRVLKLTVLDTEALNLVREGTVKTQAVIDGLTEAEELDVPEVEVPNVVSRAIVEAAKAALEEGKNKASGRDIAQRVRETVVPEEDEEEELSEADMIQTIQTFTWERLKLKDLIKIYNIVSENMR